MLIKHNRTARRWLGPTVLRPRSLWAQGESGCLYDFSAATGNLDGSDVLVTAGASLKTAQDKRSGVANPAGLTSTQATVAARGKWGMGPVAGIRNMVSETRVLSGAGWGKSANGTGLAPVVTDNAEISPDGTMTASRIVMDKGAGTTVSDTSTIQTAVITVTGRQYVQSIWLRTTDGTTRQVQFRDDVGINASTVLTVTPVWQRFSISGTATGTSSSLKLWLRGGLGTADYASLAVWTPQMEIGATVTTAQMVTAGGLDISEGALLRAGFWRPDLADDVLAWTLPAAVAGELFIIGRTGSWIESRAAAAGTAVALGPTGTSLTPGILRAVGDVIAAGFVGRTLSPAERLRLIRAFRGAGARGQLQAGAEAVVNGGFASDASWANASTGTGSMSISGGQCTLTGVDASNRGRVTQTSIPTVAGQAYLLSYEVVSGTGNLQIIAGTTVIMGAASPGTKQAVIIADSAAISFSANVYSTATVVLDNVSLKLLTPEALA